MSKIGVGIFCALALIVIAILVTSQQQSQFRLKEQNETLRQQISQLTRASADNQRLASVLAQVDSSQAKAASQLEELIKLRTEVTRLRKEREDLDEAVQAKTSEGASNQLAEWTALRNEMSGLSEAIGALHQDIQELQITGGTTAPRDERPNQSANTNASPDDTALGIRVIETHLDSFPDKLKRAASAQDTETFPEVYSRFLQAKGVNTSVITGAFFDERTGRIIVRGPRGVLDQIEQLTLALDRAQ